MSVIKIEGVEELIKALEQLPKVLANRVLSKTMRKAAKTVLRRARSLVPVGKTHKLKDSLKVRAGKRRKDFKIMRVITAEGWFKGPTFYGGFLEYGTDERFHKSGKSVGAISRVGFMKKAYDMEAVPVALTLRHDILQGVEAAVQELRTRR